MSDHLLLNSQRNQVFAALQEAGLDPASFRWERVGSIQTAGLYVPRLVHVPSASWFQFDLLRAGHWCRYSPGADKHVEEQYPGGWPHQIDYVRQWVRNLKREIETPDLWSAISGEAALVFGTPVVEDDTNRVFDALERQRLSRSLSEIRNYLVATHDLSDARAAFVDERLRYLEEAAGRVGRKDWINLAYGALINIIVGAALAPAAAKDLLRLAGSALAWILGGLPILPTPAE
jgi:hypothetical protein